MAKKVIFILILAFAFGAFLILRPYLIKNSTPPTIVDRLPDDEYIGRIKLLDFARESQKITEKNKVSIKDFLSYEFLLSQSKNYGVDLQKPAYVFGNSKGEFGLLVQLKDSSKVLPGINRLKIVYPIKDSLYESHKVYSLKKEKLYFYYDKTYAFFYRGGQFKSKFTRITEAKSGGQTSAWKSFLNESQFKNDFFVISSNSKTIKELGINRALVSIHSDSSNFLLKTAISKNKPLNVRLKNTGYSFEKSPETSSCLDLHLDIADFRENPDNELMQLINRYTKRISFPTKEFLNAWEGDVSYIQGGLTSVTETYIETVMDEEFNPIEVRRAKSVSVPKYSVMLSMNDKKESFFQLLMQKGIMRADGAYFRFLTSPPLSRKEHKNQIIFNSGDVLPKISESTENFGFYNMNGNKYEFALNEIQDNFVLGEIKIQFSQFLYYINLL